MVPLAQLQVAQHLGPAGIGVIYIPIGLETVQIIQAQPRTLSHGRLSGKSRGPRPLQASLLLLLLELRGQILATQLVHAAVRGDRAGGFEEALWRPRAKDGGADGIARRPHPCHPLPE